MTNNPWIKKTNTMMKKNNGPILIYLGQFEPNEAKEREKQARELAETWKESIGETITKDWIVEELEKRDIRAVGKTRPKSERIHSNSAISTRSENMKKKQITIFWQGATINVGRCPTTEAEKKQATAKALLGKWRQKVPLPSREWVVSEIKERLGLVYQKRKSTSSSRGQFRNTIGQDADFNITSKYLKKNKETLSGIWILDRSLGSSSIRPCLETINLPQEMIDAHVDKKEDMDVMCHINLCDSRFKIRSFYVQDAETPPRVMNLPLDEEIVERYGGKRTLITNKSPNQVVMKISMMTVSGFMEYWDTKEIVSLVDVELPKDYTDRPERLMKQNVTLKNHDSGKSHSLVRYYLPVDV